MSALRRWIAAIVAVCAAFAAGIALGNGPLQGSSTSPRDHSVALADANAHLSQRLANLREQQAFTGALSKAAVPALLRGRLTDTSVGVLVLPGVSAATVTGVTSALATSGAQIVFTAHVSHSLIEPSRKTYVDSVGANAAKGRADLADAAHASTYARIGALFARAYTGTAKSLAVDDEASTLDQQLRGAGLVSLDRPLSRRASAVVVLATAGHGSGTAVYAVHQIELQLVDQLAASCDGVLLAAPQGAAAAGGLIAAATTGSAMTNAIGTLNVAATAAGQSIVPVALADTVAGHPGTFGMRGDVVALPPSLQTEK